MVRGTGEPGEQQNLGEASGGDPRQKDAWRRIDLHARHFADHQHRAVQLDLDPETPLLWALRDHLNLVGTKFGCGGGFCGACTVHLDGVATRSCSTPVGQVANRRVTTIEGLSANGDHPAQRAWEEIDVPQCGYCQAGQIMSCAALLERTPNPSDDQIAAAMNGNICRCGTYLRIKDAVKLAATMRSSR